MIQFDEHIFQMGGSTTTLTPGGSSEKKTGVKKNRQISPQQTMEEAKTPKKLFIVERNPLFKRIPFWGGIHGSFFQGVRN